jgi:hypothetical protein
MELHKFHKLRILIEDYEVMFNNYHEQKRKLETEVLSEEERAELELHKKISKRFMGIIERKIINYPLLNKENEL